MNGKLAGFFKHVTAKENLWKYITGFGVLIGIVLNIVRLMNAVQPSPPNTNLEVSQLTIYVHGPNGLQDYVLENSGELLVDLDGDRRFAKIGEKGRTVFNEIPAKFSGQSIPIAIKAEGYEAKNSDKTYLLSKEPVYLEIKHQEDLLTIKGIVKNADGSALLSDVLVLIENEFKTNTDELGLFSLKMDQKNFKDKYTITFSKDGYEILTDYYYPKSSQEFRLKKKE